MQRAKRKLEHIQYALELGDGPAATHLADLRFLHNCLPEINPADFVLSVEILGKRLRLPFFIDAITGSTDAVTEINRKLAQVAARTGIGMAVGSQFGAVRDGSGIASYTVVREELAKCANVIYAGGKTSRAALTPADKLTSRELRRAVKMLKKNHAQTFGGYYIAIVGPDTMYDLQEDDAFIKVSQYQDKENIYTGEIGRLFGVRLVETTEAKVFGGAGAEKADVASVIVLGQYAYGITSLKGAKPRVIVKPAGSAGTADPLDQISTVGWKMDGFGVKMLQPEYAVRIECGFSA